MQPIAERENEVGERHEGEPGKNRVECLIDEFNAYPELAREAVRRAAYVAELDRAVYRSEERAVEPPLASESSTNKIIKNRVLTEIESAYS